MPTAQKRRIRRILKEVASYAVIIFGVLAARSSLADHYHVPSGSMEYTLIPGDRVFVDKRAYGLRLPFTELEVTAGSPVRRGDIVIFDSPRDGKRLIKRIVATGGDTVAVIDGRVAIDGEWLVLPGTVDIERFDEREVRLNLRHGGGPNYVREVPEGMLLAVGDHRGNSVDGRTFGLVPESAIYGRAIAVYYRRGEGLAWESL